jgi:hypothetical protein
VSRLTNKLSTIFLTVLVCVVLIGCGVAIAGEERAGHAGNDKARQDAVIDRQNNFARAQAKYPAPTDLNNFVMRGALVEFARRQDMTNHPWYIYLLGDNGNAYGYYVGSTYPQSTCNFLSSTEQFVDLPDAVWGETQAPSYDGMFYGACDSTEKFFFDLQTNQMIIFNVKSTTSDGPLSLDVEYLGPGQEHATPEPTTIENVTVEGTGPTPTPLPYEDDGE